MKSIGPILPNTEAFMIAHYFKKNEKSIVYIGKDEREITNICLKLNWIIPDTQISLYKAWDQIPYDNVSPSKEIQIERLKTLHYLNHKNQKKNIILTTINAITQKTLPINELSKNFYEISKEQEIKIESLITLLNFLGYERVSIVRDKTEFAIRGSIIDIYLSEYEKPIRIDLFDKQIDNIVEFDPITQKRLKKSNINQFSINATNELILNKKKIEYFKSRFRKIFPNYRKSQVYEIFSNGIIPPGGFQYLPLFYENLSSFFDYIKDYSLIIHDDFNKLVDERFENLNDYFTVRINSDDSFYLNPEYLYLNKNNLTQNINSFKPLKFSPFYNKNFIQSNLKKISNLSSIKKEIDFNFIKKFFEINSKEKKIIICCNSLGTMNKVSKILAENINLYPNQIDNYSNISNSNLFITVLKIEDSFELNKILYLNEKTIFGYSLSTKSQQIKKNKFLFEELNKLSKDTLLVHSEYGICRFNNIKKIDLNDSIHDCLELEFADSQKLYLPVENLNLITKYGDEQNDYFKLDRLGASSWQKRKADAKKKIKDAAKKLIKIASKRLQSKSLKIDVHNKEYDKFCSTFPYVETEDQLNTIQDVLNDFEKDIPSDRLIVGDVAFGKTEVIMRATFLAAKSKVQSVILVPTTLLSRQHFNNFKKRFNLFNIHIAELSRLVSSNNRDKIFKECSDGKIDILIGTHALLSDKLSFNNLGLIVYDEEQKLGTLQKEKFKNIAPNAHVISLSATPIPRTLSMALSGIRDLSIILTAPYERLAVRSYVSTFDEVTIAQAIKREVYGRMNGVYFVTPRTKDIPFLENFLKKYLPEIKYVVTHGKLSSTLLEKRISKFYNQEIPLMISTNIIENGLDLPHVNTIIVYRANLFSLSALYQLKGRVGRSSTRGYAYITFNDNELKENGKKRLSIINSTDSLGSGFNIASQDLEIRGGGSIIGEEQSGFIKEIGTELYHHMLEKEILFQKENNKNKKLISDSFQPNIKIPEEIFIPENYIDDVDLRLSIYKRISNLENVNDLTNLIIEIKDRFGEIPNQLLNLFKLIELKIQCINSNIDQFEFSRKGILISFYKNQPSNPKKILEITLNQKNNYTLRKDQKIFYDFKGELNEDRFELSNKIIKHII